MREEEESKERKVIFLFLLSKGLKVPSKINPKIKVLIKVVMVTMRRSTRNHS